MQETITQFVINPVKVSTQESIQLHASSCQIRVLDVIMHYPQGLTCREVSEILGLARHRVSGRITELADLGLIHSSGKVKDEISQKFVLKWRTGT